MSDEERAKALFFEASDLFDAGEYAAAETLLRQVLTLVPERSSVLGNLAAALFRQQKSGEAVEKAERAIALDADNTDALLVLASAQRDLHLMEPALAAFDRLIERTPDDVDAWIGRARTLRDLSRWSEAVAACDEVLRLAPDSEHIKGQRLFARLESADWDGIAEEAAAIVADIRRGAPASAPFEFLGISGDPADQLACARLYAETKVAATPPLWTGERYAHDRIRVAYVSPDFRHHAVAFLTAGLFEHHDHSRFETIAISLGEDDGSPLRRTRLPQAFDHFIHMREYLDREIASAIREMEVDIVVDLAGYTGGARTAILAARPAPVQVSYLGYPASMGAPYIDYIVADRFVLPETSRAAYTEQPVYLPDSFQVNDDARPLPPPPTRAEAGLPASGFVFCCFNAPYKIRPEVFDIWMRLLSAVPGSVLWLISGSTAFAENLHRAAESRGIDPARLIFAGKRMYDQHLARFQLADLFLDTLPYNGGATASDALWCGVPVVTCAGEAFASRMAVSLLNAVGLPELVADSMADYEALALKVASTPALAAEFKARLTSDRSRLPLFDTARFTRHIEAAYVEMWQRTQRGEVPQSFAVAPIG